MTTLHTAAQQALTDEQIDSAIHALDKYVHDVDIYDYGLPIYDEEHMPAMRELVRAALSHACDQARRVVADNIGLQAPEGGPALTDEALLGAIARGWCHPGCTDIEMNATLAQAIAHEVRAALAAPAPQAPAWQPIETAPEGTMILCANMKAREARDWCFVAWMVKGKVCGHRMDMPTHWMPLPAAPQTKEPKA